MSNGLHLLTHSALGGDELPEETISLPKSEVGSGTALVESRLLGRNAYGIDLNPLAVFLARVKSTEINPAKLTDDYFDLLKRIAQIKDSELKKPDFKNIDFWFKEEVILKLAKIKKAINAIKNAPIRNFFLTSFSETVRLSSNTNSSEFKLVRIKGNKLENYNPDVLGIFKKKTEINIAGMRSFYQDVDKTTWAKPIYGDTSQDNTIKENSVDCIITSPPYGDSRTTVAYGQFSRLSAQWIDIFEDPNVASGVDNLLLGGRPTASLNHSLPSPNFSAIVTSFSRPNQSFSFLISSLLLYLLRRLR